LLCSTLHAIFAGRRDLFEGLAIGASDWKWEKHPVIRLDMSGGSFSNGAAACEAAIRDRLLIAARELGVSVQGETLASRFEFLIKDARAKHGAKVAVIIDEYDNPLLSVIDEPGEFDAVRKILRDFYKVVKVAEADLRFTFLTGVTKFSKVSVFSALNNLTDITLDSRFADLCGITQEEMERDFSEYIDKYAGDFGGRAAYIARLKDYYNGCRFTKKPQTVYNPFGLLPHFDNGEFAPYWFESGTPAYLVKLLQKHNMPVSDLSGAVLTMEDFRNFNLEEITPVPLLFQSGYLTIQEYDETFDRYTLDYPNTEVRGAFANDLSRSYLGISPAEKGAILNKVPELLYKGELGRAINEGFIPFLAAIPHNIALKEEKYFQTVFHIIFNMLGLRCRSEVCVAAGRADSIVETPRFVYRFEFKLGKTKRGNAAAALAQIDTKEYLTPWRGTGKTLVKVGVSFDTEKRNIAEWKSVPAAP
jgi:hypothetical protein